MTRIDFREYEKESAVKSKILKHKESVVIALFIGIALSALTTLDIQFSEKPLDEEAVLKYMMTISDRYNSFYFMHNNLEITDAEYLSELLSLKSDYEIYLKAAKNHEWKLDGVMTNIDSFQFELDKINQEILVLKNL